MMARKIVTMTLLLVVSVLTSIGQESTDEVENAEFQIKDLRDNIPEFIKGGKLNLNIRPRYEFADMDGLDASNAFTVRTALGFETAPLYGFRAKVEMEDVTVLGNEDNYAQPGGLSGPGKTVVADPEGTELNQGWLAYRNWDTELMVGRQNLVLDNSRFIGNVAWRQNHQTLDAVTFKNQSIEDLTLLYGYIWNVNRIFGEDLAFGDWESESHMFNISYKGCPWGTLGVYAYLLDFDTDAPLASVNTFGAYYSGSHSITDDGSVQYRAEYARQTDTGKNTDFDADYYLAELGATYDRFNGGVGYEILGSRGGAGGPGFSTPLATLHKFNGWADAFLGTPAIGLHDLYVWAGAEIPKNIPLKFVYHQYTSDTGSMDLGEEYDIVASRKFGEHWGILGKYAYFDGQQDGPADRHKFWLQGTFDY
ncbi:MAG TPA: hypothetical protein EYQ50_12515 [Verrucomicrobiales bacterium]|nr:hypothetical protein [Verrucomicrobiales bacterium]